MSRYPDPSHVILRHYPESLHSHNFNRHTELLPGTQPQTQSDKGWPAHNNIRKDQQQLTAQFVQIKQHSLCEDCNDVTAWHHPLFILASSVRQAWLQIQWAVAPPIISTMMLETQILSETMDCNSVLTFLFSVVNFLFPAVIGYVA
jgi:hypothetical protein